MPVGGNYAGTRVMLTRWYDALTTFLRGAGAGFGNGVRRDETATLATAAGGPSAQNGGELGYFTRAEMPVQSVADAAFSLK